MQLKLYSPLIDMMVITALGLLFVTMRLLSTFTTLPFLSTPVTLCNNERTITEACYCLFLLSSIAFSSYGFETNIVNHKHSMLHGFVY